MASEKLLPVIVLLLGFSAVVLQTTAIFTNGWLRTSSGDSVVQTSIWQTLECQDNNQTACPLVDTYDGYATLAPYFAIVSTLLAVVGFAAVGVVIQKCKDKSSSAAIQKKGCALMLPFFAACGFALFVIIEQSRRIHHAAQTTDDFTKVLCPWSLVLYSFGFVFDLLTCVSLTVHWCRELTWRPRRNINSWHRLQEEY